MSNVATVAPAECWIRAAVAVSDQLSQQKLFPPQATIRVGSSPDNDFIVDVPGIETHIVVSDGTSMHLLPGWEARMAGPTTELVVARYETEGALVRVAAERVHLRLGNKISVLLAYHATRAEAERAIQSIPTIGRVQERR